MSILPRWLIDPVKPAHKALSRKSLLHILAPKGAHLARVWMKAQPEPAWRTVCLILGLITMGVGWFTLVADWYSSVQGIRYPAMLLGLIEPQHFWAFPGVWWWPFSLVITIAQMLPKVVPGLRPIWYPATIYSSTTNAIFVALLINALLRALEVTPSLILVGFLASFFGLVIAVYSERAFLTGALLLETAVTWED